MTVRALLGTVLAAAALAGSASGFGGPEVASPTIPDCDAHAFIPRTLTLACGDANYGLTGMAWPDWGAKVATGIGFARANDCTPNCAAGRFHTYSVTATASRLRTCRDGVQQYTRLVVGYSGKRPAGMGPSDPWRFPCDAPGPGPTLVVKALGAGRIDLTGTGWQRSAGCQRKVALRTGSMSASPFAAAEIGRNLGFHLVLKAPKKGRLVVIASQPCYTLSSGLRIYEHAIAMTVR